MIVFKTQLRLTVLSAHAAVKHRQWGNQTNLEVCQNQSPVKIARTQNTTVPSSLSPFSSENSRRQTETSLSLSRSLSLFHSYLALLCPSKRTPVMSHILFCLKLLCSCLLWVLCIQLKLGLFAGFMSTLRICDVLGFKTCYETLERAHETQSCRGATRLS